MVDIDKTTQQDEVAPVAKKKPWQRFSRSGGHTAAGTTAGATTTTATTTSTGRGGGHTPDVAKLRTMLARLLWAISAVFALILAIAVFLIAVDANADNELVRWMIARADNVDLGFFDLQNPIKDFDKSETDPAQDVKTALFNYGVAAIVWLGIGKFLDRVVRA